jgi:hypothetical protein
MSEYISFFLEKEFEIYIYQLQLLDALEQVVQPRSETTLRGVSKRCPVYWYSVKRDGQDDGLHVFRDGQDTLETLVDIVQRASYFLQKTVHVLDFLKEHVLVRAALLRVYVLFNCLYVKD